MSGSDEKAFRALPSALRAAAAKEAGNAWPTTWSERLQCVHEFAETPEGASLVKKLEKLSAEDEARQEKEAQTSDAMRAETDKAMAKAATDRKARAAAEGWPSLDPASMADAELIAAVRDQGWTLRFTHQYGRREMSHFAGSFHDKEHSREKSGTLAFEEPERLVKWVQSTVVDGEWEWRRESGEGGDLVSGVGRTRPHPILSCLSCCRLG